MHRCKSFILASSILALAHAAAAAAQEPAAADPQGDPAAAGNDDIVVTASRRSERLQDVPSAISALGGDQLERLGAQSFADYSALVPGLSQRDSGAPGLGTVIIRGLNTGAQQTTNTAATYVDDAAFSSSGFLGLGALLTPDPDIADIDRIEVLKGPQGTLYGANSLGGLVRIVSNRPKTNQFSGQVTAEGSTVDGGGEGYAFRGTVNLPIVADKLAIRVNGVYRKAPGWTDNIGTGEKNSNDSTIKGARVALRWTPTSDLTVDLAGMIQDIRNDGSATQDNIGGTLIPRTRRYQYSTRFPATSHLKYRIATASVDYDMGPVTLIASGSYAAYRTEIISDYSESYIPFLRAASPAVAAIIPADGGARANFAPDMDKYTLEARLVSERMGPVEFIVGGFYTNESNSYFTGITALDGDNRPLSAPFDILFRGTTLSDYEEIAGFANATLYLSDRFDIGGGIRFAHNKQRAELAAGGDAISFYVPRASQVFHFSDDVLTYLATARWRPSRDISLYARAASGYRPGGPQTNSTPPPGAQTVIRSDTVWNYEAGINAALLENQLNIRLAGYHIDWKNIQLNTLAGGTVLLSNGGDAKVDGFELELTARPSPLLTVAANLGYTKARISRVDPGVAASIGAASGDRLPLTADWTAAIIADHRIPLGGEVEANLGATLKFRSDMPSSFPGAFLDPNVKIPSLATIDLRAGIRFDRFDIQARAENVTNQFGISTIATSRLFPGQDVPSNVTVNRPRTFTLSVTTRF